MRKLIPHILLAVMTLGAGVAALSSFQSTRFTGAFVELKETTCLDQGTNQPIPASETPIKTLVPSWADYSSQARYATPASTGLVAVAPAGWFCRAATGTPAGVDIRSNASQTQPATIIEYLITTGEAASRMACPYNKEAHALVDASTDAVTTSQICTPAPSDSIIRKIGDFVIIKSTSATTGTIYGALSFHKTNLTSKLGVCVPIDEKITSGNASYTFDAGACLQYLRTFALNNG
jgi:hypothetical protein